MGNGGRSEKTMEDLFDEPDDSQRNDPFESITYGTKGPKAKGQDGFAQGEATLTDDDIKAAESARAWTTERMATAAAIGAAPKTSEDYPFSHPMLMDLRRAGRNSALANLAAFLEEPQPVGKDQRLTPIHGGGAPLRIPLAGQPIEIDLHTIDRSGGTAKVGALVESKVAVHEGHSIPAGAWFSGLETLEGGRMNIPPSFAASSTKAQSAYKIPAVVDLLNDQVITSKDAVLLMQSATGEFSAWLKGANQHKAVQHPRFQPLAVSTFTERDWHEMVRKAEHRGGFTETLEPWRVVLPSQTGVVGPKLMIFKGRGYFINRELLLEIDRDAATGHRGFNTRDEKKALGLLPKLGMIQNGNGAGIATGYEHAAWTEQTPGALFIPTERSEVLTIPIREDDIYMAVQAMTAMQQRNLEMTVHTGMQAQELGIKEMPVWLGQALGGAQKVGDWMRRKFRS